MEIQSPPQIHKNSLTSILSYISNAQSNHGLRHNDYHRYRIYCHNKIKKIRNKISFSYAIKQSKHLYRFTKKSIAQFDNQKVTQILLLMAQKQWAYAMELKQQYGKNKRSKYHARKKFSKAVLYSQILNKSVMQLQSNNLKTEAQVYVDLLRANKYFQKQDWQKSTQNLIKSNKILIQLGGFEDKLEIIEQQLKFCYYKLKRKNISFQNISNLKMVNHPLLSSKLQEQVFYKEDKICIQFMGDKLQLKGQQIIKGDIKIKQKEQLIKTLRLNNSQEQVINMAFLGFFQQIEQQCKLIKQNKQDQKLINYYYLKKHLHYFQKWKYQINSLVVKLDQQDPVKNLKVLFTKKAIKLKLVRLHQVVKICEHCQQTIKNIVDIQRLNKTSSTLLKQIFFYQLYYQILKSSISGLIYIGLKKLKEGASILLYCSKWFQNYKLKYQQLIKEDIKVVLAEPFEKTQERINYYLCKVFLQFGLNKSQQSKLIVKMENLSIKNKVINDNSNNHFMKWLKITKCNRMWTKNQASFSYLLR